MDSDKFGSSQNSNGRKARSKHKDIDRRIKRREHAHITRKALREYEHERWESETFFDDVYADHDYMDDISLYDLAAEEEDRWASEHDNSYDPFEDWSYDNFDTDYDFVRDYNRVNRQDYLDADNFYARKSINHHTNCSITHDDVGMTLAEILERSMK
jgi:hypothetical protein